MPVQYGGIREEHVAVRTTCGVFDVSHMGQIETSGPQATKLLQRLLSNDVEKIAVGGAQYSVLCREDGGVLDDLFTYRLAPDRFLTVTNAANHEKDLAWFRRHAAAATGYTGEDGVELLLDPDDAPDVWDTLLAEGVVPCGLAARDTLRLEACFHLYGNDLSEDRTPIEAGLGWCCKEDTGFIGSEPLRGLEPGELLAPFAFTEPGIP